MSKCFPLCLCCNRWSCRNVNEKPSCQGQATLLVQGTCLRTYKYLIKTHCKICHHTRPLSQYESVRGGRHSGVAFTGRANGKMGESPQSGHLLAQAPSFLVMGSKMQQLTVATAGFEHAQAGTAETHLAKEIPCLAAFPQTKLPLPFPGREGARRGNETPERIYPKVLSPRWGLPECLAGSREPTCSALG